MLLKLVSYVCGCGRWWLARSSRRKVSPPPLLRLTEQEVNQAHRPQHAKPQQEKGQRHKGRCEEVLSPADDAQMDEIRGELMCSVCGVGCVV